MSHRWQAGSGAPWEAQVGYARVVRIGERVWVTGTIALDDAGGPFEGDAEAQTRRALAIVERALGRVGASLADVARTRIFVTDIARDWEAVGRAHGAAFGAIRPATTMVEVSALIEPWAKVEIEAEAVMGAAPARVVPDVVVTAATAAEVGPLLAAVSLPPADPEAPIIAARTAAGAIVASASWWTAGQAVLLRSCAVAPDWRRRDLGTLLVDVALVRARAGGARVAYAVTETAQDFFAALGFTRCDDLPTRLKARLPHACARAVTMRREL